MWAPVIPNTKSPRALAEALVAVEDDLKLISLFS
jgi:hypothetical protein